MASAALDVESHILESSASIEEVHGLACATGFAGTSEELITALGGYLVYAGLLPGVQNGVVVFAPPPSDGVSASGTVGGGFSMS